jgi:hypothetical protein
MSVRKCACKRQSRHGAGRHGWVAWLWPLMGLVALVWFLVRVIPKPSRAAYPCQRVAAPLASGFVVWLTTAVGSTLVYRRAKALWGKSRYVAAGLLAIVAVEIVWFAISVTGEPRAVAFTPADPPNAPIGVARGIHPGRVVWVYDPNVANWDGHTGNWWDEDNTDQGRAHSMVSLALRALTGEFSDIAAWDALFRYFNRDHGYGDVGYRPGEKIAIKINMNEDTSNDEPWPPDAGMSSPQVIHSLVHQLIRVVGVSGGDITVYDVSKYIGDPIYTKVHDDPDPEFHSVRFVVVPWMAGNGREPAREYPAPLVHCSDPRVSDQGGAYLPETVVEAAYLIDVGLFRSHQDFGVTLCAKNFFGSLKFPDSPWGPGPFHYLSPRSGRPAASYSPLVDLLGHAQLGGKTLLYLIDALYGQEEQMGPVVRFSSFGNDWSSSLFASQDPVAIDSVGLDFLRNEPKALYCSRVPNIDDYLHEAALADDPPSGTFYDPEGDGTRLRSLGVHEHWNNPVDRQYSRNLDTGHGIELVEVQPNCESADVTCDGAVDARDLAVFVQGWLADPNSSRWDARCDWSANRRIDFDDLARFGLAWRWMQSL